MTLQLMLETVLASYPTIGQTEITAILKSVVDDFCKRSRLLKQSVSVSSTFTTDLADLGADGIALLTPEPGFIANVYEGLETWDSGNLGFYEVESVQYDTDLLPRYPNLGYRVWWVQRALTQVTGLMRDRLVIGSMSTSGVSGKSELTTAVDVRITGSCTIASGFVWTTLTSVLPIPEEFHYGIIYGVLKQLALLKDRDARLAQSFAVEYERSVIEAMKRGNTAGMRGSARIITEHY